MKCVITLLAGLMAVVMNAASFDNVKFMTETYPPYNFREAGQLKGIAVEIIEQVFKDTGSKLTQKDVKLLPWKRAYEDCKSNTATCLFSTTKTEERDKIFKWAGPIAPTRIVVIAPKSRGVKINSAEDLKKFKFGAVMKDIGETLLLDSGVEKGKIDAVSKLDINLKKLKAGRLDAVAYEENVAFYTMKSMGINTADYEVVYALKESELYFAFNKNEKQEVVDEIQKAVDKIIKDGRKQKIMDKYLK